MKSAWVTRLLTLLAAGGVFVAGSLSAAAFLNLSLPCGQGQGCDVVAAHPASKWLGIPVAAFGLAAYLVLGLLAFLLASRGPEDKSKIARSGLLLSGIGTLISGYLTYVAFFQIKATCNWCIASAVIMAATFLLYGYLTQRGTEGLGGGGFETVFFGAALFAAVSGIGLQTVATDRAIQQSTATIANLQGLKIADLVNDPGRFKGPADAPITIVEYADFYCGTCRDFHPRLSAVAQQFPSRIRVAFVPFPLFQLSGHENAMVAAGVAQAALEEGKYWEMVNELFTGPVEGIREYETLLSLAEDVGLDREVLKRRLAETDPKLFDPVLGGMDKARSIGVFSTPTFIVFADGLPTRAVTAPALPQLLESEPYARLLEGENAGSQ